MPACKASPSTRTFVAHEAAEVTSLHWALESVFSTGFDGAICVWHAEECSLLQRFYNVQQRPRSTRRHSTAVTSSCSHFSCVAIAACPMVLSVWTGSMEETIATWDCLSSFPTPHKEHQPSIDTPKSTFRQQEPPQVLPLVDLTHALSLASLSAFRAVKVKLLYLHSL